MLKNAQCPLSDPSLDLIPTNAHHVGACLCSYCTCGLHLCPNMVIKDPFPGATFTTKYMSEYKKNRFDHPVKPEPRLYRPNKQPMELKTSNKEDYEGIHTKPAAMIWPHKPNAPQKPMLNSTTVNSYNYPDWCSKHVMNEKRWHPPVRTTELPFKGKSSYSRSFSPISQKNALAFKTDYSESTAYQTTFSLGPTSRFDDRTTYGEKMQNFNGNGLNSRIKVRAPTAEKVKASSNHFYTTANSFYTTPKQKIDPRQLKIYMDLRGSTAESARNS